MKSVDPRILAINGGSSSIKFALFEVGDSLRRILEGGIERIGLPEATLQVKGVNQADNFARSVTAPLGLPRTRTWSSLRKNEHRSLNNSEEREQQFSISMKHGGNRKQETVTTITRKEHDHERNEIRD